jgi:hypothetical protein
MSSLFSWLWPALGVKRNRDGTSVGRSEAPQSGPQTPLAAPFDPGFESYARLLADANKTTSLTAPVSHGRFLSPVSHGRFQSPAAAARMNQTPVPPPTGTMSPRHVKHLRGVFAPQPSQSADPAFDTAGLRLGTSLSRPCVLPRWQIALNTSASIASPVVAPALSSVSASDSGLLQSQIDSVNAHTKSFLRLRSLSQAPSIIARVAEPREIQIPRAPAPTLRQSAAAPPPPALQRSVLRGENMKYSAAPARPPVSVLARPAGEPRAHATDSAAAALASRLIHPSSVGISFPFPVDVAAVMQPQLPSLPQELRNAPCDLESNVSFALAPRTEDASLDEQVASAMAIFSRLSSRAEHRPFLVNEPPRDSTHSDVHDELLTSSPRIPASNAPSATTMTTELSNSASPHPVLPETSTELLSDSGEDAISSAEDGDETESDGSSSSSALESASSSGGRLPESIVSDSESSEVKGPERRDASMDDQEDTENNATTSADSDSEAGGESVEFGDHSSVRPSAAGRASSSAAPVASIPAAAAPAPELVDLMDTTSEEEEEEPEAAPAYWTDPRKSYLYIADPRLSADDLRAAESVMQPRSGRRLLPRPGWKGNRVVATAAKGTYCTAGGVQCLWDGEWLNDEVR